MVMIVAVYKRVQDCAQSVMHILSCWISGGVVPRTFWGETEEWGQQMVSFEQYWEVAGVESTSLEVL